MLAKDKQSSLLRILISGEKKVFMILTTDQQRRNSPSGDAHRRLLRPRLQGPLEHQPRQARNILLP
jgi:hypothetical protein